VGKVAIIGTGITGMGCAYFLHKHYDIDVFEKQNYIGGHTNTAIIEEDGKPVNIDTGFIVCNPINYPNLFRLFEKLDVPLEKTDMSFGVQHRPSELEYCGSGFNGLFGQRKNIFDFSFIKMLNQINRFNDHATEIINDKKYYHYSVAEYIEEMKLGEDFLYKYLAPMSSALWSVPTSLTLKFPIYSLVRFFHNHGLLGLNTHYQWYTVTNGSESYKQKLIAPFKEKIKINCGAKKIEHIGDKIEITIESGEKKLYDKVIFACHGDQALSLLENPTTEQRKLLSPFTYQKNIATLHWDENVMPKTRRVWSAWNYLIDNKKGENLTSTIYYMNKLQNLKTKKNYFVSINDFGEINEKKILKQYTYEHPVFTVDALEAQDKLATLNTSGPIYFCGSYFGHGFHEDAFKSAVDVCGTILKRDVWS